MFVMDEVETIRILFWHLHIIKEEEKTKFPLDYWLRVVAVEGVSLQLECYSSSIVIMPNC